MIYKHGLVSVKLAERDPRSVNQQRNTPLGKRGLAGRTRVMCVSMSWFSLCVSLYVLRSAEERAGVQPDRQTGPDGPVVHELHTLMKT